MSGDERRQCPECLRPWPQNDPRLKLAGFGWLGDLPRDISPNNVDCLLHDGYMGRNRFLALETKRPDEPLLSGQARALMGLARLDPFTVRVLRGTVAVFTVLRVTGAGIEAEGKQTTGASFRAAVASWLNGSLWRDAEAILEAPAPATDLWPDGINPHVTPERRDELLALRAQRPEEVF